LFWIAKIINTLGKSKGIIALFRRKSKGIIALFRRKSKGIIALFRGKSKGIIALGYFVGGGGMGRRANIMGLAHVVETINP
jgi:hypothetical protein